jgi:3-phenylpropionate/trans-cinnamate dioxygenase ferredoxin reductase subunit
VTGPARVVVVGGGHAGFHLALFLRSGAWAGEVTLVEAQVGLPYQRPPLSKDFLAGKQELDDTLFRPASFYPDKGIALVRDRTVAAIERSTGQVVLSDGARLPYDHLVLATGSRPRPLAVPGADLDGVLSLATGHDAEVLRDRIGQARRVAVLGGGFIGLETAAVAASAGRTVTVFEAADRFMSRVISEPMSRYFEQLHRAHDVNVLLSTPVARLEGADGRVAAVVTADGTRVEADLVVVGIGAVPNDELAASAGLDTANGVLVDSTLRTADPRISAIGDCARFMSRFAADTPNLRLESVQNATDQARFVADVITGAPRAPAYDAVPWFWTDQFGSKLQIAGLVAGHDQINREHSAEDRFSLNCYRGGLLLGSESVNSPREHLRARRQLATALEKRG